MPVQRDLMLRQKGPLHVHSVIREHFLPQMEDLHALLATEDQLNIKLAKRHAICVSPASTWLLLVNLFVPNAMRGLFLVCPERLGVSPVPRVLSRLLLKERWEQLLASCVIQGPTSRLRAKVSAPSVSSEPLGMLQGCTHAHNVLLGSSQTKLPRPRVKLVPLAESQMLRGNFIVITVS